MDSGEEGSSELVVAGGNSPELLDFVEETLNTVPAFVAKFVVIEPLATTGDGWDHWFNPIHQQSFTNPVGIIAFIK